MDLIFTDPPYNVAVDGHVGGLGKVKHREFAFASGSTLIAAEEAGRKARLIEYDPAYCDVIVARWEKLTGKGAERVA